MFPMDPISKPNTLAEAYLEAIQKAGEKAKTSLTKAKEVMKRRWDNVKWKEEQLKEGDLVLVFSDNLPSKRPSKKLDDKWYGPFKIMVLKGPSAYKLDLLASWKGHQTFNESKLKKYSQLHFEMQKLAPRRPDPELTAEGQEECKVEEVLAKQAT
jgi:hypothetical protein